MEAGRGFYLKCLYSGLSNAKSKGGGGVPYWTNSTDLINSKNSLHMITSSTI